MKVTLRFCPKSDFGGIVEKSCVGKVLRKELEVDRKTRVEDLLPRFNACSMAIWSESNQRAEGNYYEAGGLDDGYTYNLCPHDIRQLVEAMK